MTCFDEQKMFKLPVPYRFFDINDLWYFPKWRVVRWLFPLSVSANQITGLSLIMGLVSVGFYFSTHPHALIWGAVFLYAKHFFDNIDGPLARARDEVSRFGRFLDSFTDFVINVFVYAALSYYLVRQTGEAAWWVIGFTALLSCFIHCSFFVFYLVQYTSQVGTYKENRPREIITEEDQHAYAKGDLSSAVYCLQRFHEWAYDWQDLLMEKLDRVCRRMAGTLDEQFDSWYGNKTFLTTSSPLCLCTNTMALIVFSLLNQVDFVLLSIIVVGNFFMVGIMTWKILHFRMAFPRPQPASPHTLN